MTSDMTPHSQRPRPVFVATAPTKRSAHTLLAAAALVVMGLALVAPGNASADPFGDAATTGWDRQAVDVYRGFFLPGVAPFTAEFDSDKVMWLGLPCQSANADASELALRASAGDAGSDITYVCPDTHRKITGAR